MPHGWIGKPSMPAALAAPADSFDLFSPARPLASPPFKSETDHASQERLVNIFAVRAQRQRGSVSWQFPVSSTDGAN